MDGNKERDKKQSALPKELQEKFMTTDSAVLQTKKLNSGEHYADLDTSESTLFLVSSNVIYVRKIY